MDGGFPDAWAPFRLFRGRSPGENLRQRRLRTWQGHPLLNRVLRSSHWYDQSIQFSNGDPMSMNCCCWPKRHPFYLLTLCFATQILNSLDLYRDKKKYLLNKSWTLAGGSSNLGRVPIWCREFQFESCWVLKYCPLYPEDNRLADN